MPYKTITPESRCSTRLSGVIQFIPTKQTKRQYKLFCLDFILLFVPDYLNYPYYLSLPIYCYHFVINLDNTSPATVNNNNMFRVRL